MAKVGKREIEQAEQLRRQLNGTAGLVQCEGCPGEVLVQPGRPGHLDSCRECSRHCDCFTDHKASEPDF